MQTGAQGGTCGACGKKHAFLLWLGVCAVNPVEYLGEMRKEDEDEGWEKVEQKDEDVHTPIGNGF